jgi:serine/threonine protein kinase
MDEPVRKISDFHLTGSLHSGSRAEVHEGRFAQAGGVVQNAAVKVLHPRFACIGDELRSFLSEVGWASDLRSAIFPRVFEAGEHRGNYFLAMERVDGWTLSEVLSSLVTLKVPLPCEVGLSIVHQLAAGLHVMHEHREEGHFLGVVHLGISPDNIMLSKVGQAKLLDFGMMVATAEGGMTQPDDRAKDYQAPERLRALPVDRRADVYSLGRVLQHMVTCMVDDVVGSDLPVLMARAIHNDPDQRFATMEDFNVALEVVAKNRGITPSIRACEKFTLEIFGHKVGHTDPRAQRPQSVVPLRMASEGQDTAFTAFGEAPKPPRELETLVESNTEMAREALASFQKTSPGGPSFAPEHVMETAIGGEVAAIGTPVQDPDVMPTAIGGPLAEETPGPRFVDEHMAVTSIGPRAPAAAARGQEVTAFSQAAPASEPAKKGGFPEEMIPTRPYEAHTLD